MDTEFSPEHVERQIQSLLQIEERSSGKANPSLQQFVHELQLHYKPVDRHKSLQRVWLRILEQEKIWQQQSAQTQRPQPRITHLIQWKNARRQQELITFIKEARLLRYLGLAAVAALVALIIGRGIHVLSQQKRWIPSGVSQSAPSLLTAHK